MLKLIEAIQKINEKELLRKKRIRMDKHNEYQRKAYHQKKLSRVG